VVQYEQAGGLAGGRALGEAQRGHAPTLVGQGRLPREGGDQLGVRAGWSMGTKV